jgi:hypothetical protein
MPATATTAPAKEQELARAAAEPRGYGPERGSYPGWVEVGLFWVLRIGAAFLASYVGIHFLTHGNFYPAQGDFLSSFFRWDASHYLAITTYGYHRRTLEVLFPGYPVLCWLMTRVVGDPRAASLAVTDGSLLVAALGMRRLASHFLDPAGAGLAVWLLLFFPVSVFLTTGYPEATLLALTCFAFCFLLEGRPWPAAVLAGAAGAFRPDAGAVGVAVALAILTGRQGPRFRLAAVASCFSGSVAYVAYLLIAKHDPLGFAAAQSNWARRPTFPLQAEFTSIYRILKGTIPIVGQATRGNEVALYLLDDAAVYLAIVAVVVAGWWALKRGMRSYWPLVVHGAVVLVGAFSSAPYDGTSPDIAAHIVMTIPLVYLVYARLASRRASLPAAAGTALVALAVQAAFAAGYWVT